MKTRNKSFQLWVLKPLCKCVHEHFRDEYKVFFASLSNKKYCIGNCLAIAKFKTIKFQQYEGNYCVNLAEVKV